MLGRRVSPKARAPRFPPMLGGRVSPQWHLWVDSLPPKGAIGWNPSEGDVSYSPQTTPGSPFEDASPLITNQVYTDTRLHFILRSGHGAHGSRQSGAAAWALSEGGRLALLSP